MYTNHGFDERNFIFLPHICQRDNVISQKKKVSEGMIYSARARVNMINSALCRALGWHCWLYCYSLFDIRKGRS